MASVSKFFAGCKSFLESARKSVHAPPEHPFRITVGNCQSRLERRSASERARFIAAYASPALYRGLHASRSASEWEWKPVHGVVSFAPRELPSLHTLVSGASGTGKTTLAKSLIKQYATHHCVVCIDPHNEFSGVIESVGGRCFSSRSVSLSLLELESGVSPAEKVVEAVSIIRAAMPSMGDQQAYFLSKCMLAAYEEKGITRDTHTWRRKPPSLSDVSGQVSALIASSKRVDASVYSLKRRLDALVLSGVFGAKTHLPFSVIVSQPTCFDVSELRSREAQVMFVEVFLRKLYAYCQRTGVVSELIAVIDEAQFLCRSTHEFTSFAGTVCAGGRKFKIGLLMISQGFDGLDPAIAANASCVYSFFSREPKDAEYAAGLLSGSRYGPKAQCVLEELHSLPPRECLLSCTGASEVVRVSVRAPKESGAGERKPFVLGSQHQLFVFEKLRELLPNERIIYNDWRALEGFEIDVSLPHRKIAVELDGVWYHDKPEQKARDEKKDGLLAEKGWRVYRIRDDGLSYKELEERVRELGSELLRCN